jgi:hypothetical protein
MGPILQWLGVFRSYRTYESIIQRAVADLLLTRSDVKLLVAGVESEYSALAILRSVAIFGDAAQVVFADRCPTPLRRIHEYVKPHYSLDTVEIDIMNAADSRLSQAHDLILADSFIRQFAKNDKVQVLRRLAAAVRDSTCRLIVHEYTGPSDVLLARLWANMPVIAKPGGDEVYAKSLMGTPEFMHMLSELDRFYRNNGAMYASPDELRKDLSAAGMRVVAEFVKPGSPDQLVVAGLAIDPSMAEEDSIESAR